MPVIYLTPSDPLPGERHIAVIAHKDEIGSTKAYFYDSNEGDHGGSGPFDWLLEEAIERAVKFGTNRGIYNIVVVGRKTNS